jgi:hypothetical protein
MSMRTRYGKLTSTKSGDAASEMTARDKQVLLWFSFLGKHVGRITGRLGVSVSTYFSHFNNVMHSHNQENNRPSRLSNI